MAEQLGEMVGLSGHGRRLTRGSDATRLASTVIQSGVLAYRSTGRGEPLVLMVSKSWSRRWGIPKGNVEPHLSLAESAAREAFEEAGVKGRVSPKSVGVFRATKRTRDRRRQYVVEVWVYLREVTELLTKWPEKGKRQVRWVPCHTAATQLRNPVLSELCRNLAQSGGSEPKSESAPVT